MESIENLINAQENFRKDVIPLQPSENIMTEMARKALASDFNHRYSLEIDSEYRGVKIHNAYAGTRFSEQLVRAVEKLAISDTPFDFADVRPISGHIAALQVIGNVLKEGDSFLYIPQEWGGYDGYEQPYIPSMLHLKSEKIPMKNWRIDYEKLSELRKDYSAIILGASIFFYPYDLRMIRELFPDSYIFYDASHVLGLIMQEEFQHDISVVDVLYGSTHKNFPGPQGGFILGKKELEGIVKRDSIWRYYDNFHLGRIAALGITLEFLKNFDYAKRCIRNTRAFETRLIENNISVVNPQELTESCMFMIDYPDAASISMKMENSGILIDRIGRIGLNEVTMMGMDQGNVLNTANLFSKIIKNEKFDNFRAIKDILGNIRSP